MSDKINPYGQHYLATKRLFRNGTQYSIFEYLLDVHIRLVRQNITSPAIPCTASLIATNAGVTRKAVAPNLKALNKMGVVLFDEKIDNSVCYVCADYLDNIVTLFNNQKTLKLKDEVISAFQAHDLKRLYELGFVDCQEGNANLLKLHGNVYPMGQTCTNGVKPVPMGTDMYHTVQNCTNGVNVVPIGSNVYPLVQLCTIITTSFPEKRAFLDHFLRIFSDSDTQNAIISCADVIYTPDFMGNIKNGQIKSDQWVQVGVPMGQILVGILGQTCTNGYTVINNNIINKEINVSDELRSSQYIGGEKENFEIDERTDEELSEISKQRRARKSQSKGFNKEVELRRKRETFNTFSEEEVDEITSDIKNALDAPEKIFIYFLWGCLRDYIFNNFIEVDGEDYPDIDSIDLTLHAVPASQMKRCLNDAYEETLRFIKTKRLSPDDEELPVPDFEFSGEDVELVVGWEPKEDYKERGVWYHITKSQFHNLNEKLEAVYTAPNRTSRRRKNGTVDPEIEDDYSYIQKINKIGETDEGLDKLTPIEEFVYWFCQEFLEVDDNTLRPNDTRQPILWVKGEDKVKELLFNVNLPASIFPQICSMDIPKNLPETPIRPRMFSAAKIRRENQANHFTSIVDDYDKSLLEA